MTWQTAKDYPGLFAGRWGNPSEAPGIAGVHGKLMGMSNQSNEILDGFPVRVYECGCVLAVGGTPDMLHVTVLMHFPKCDAWREAYNGSDLEAADSWADKHFEETPHRVEYRQA